MKYVLLAEAFAVTTFAAGWWSVPVVAALWGMLSIDRYRARNAALSAAGGWATLLVLAAVRGQVGEMAARLGEVLQVGSVVLLALTLVFPAALAWCAAALVPGFRAMAAATSPVAAEAAIPAGETADR